jgi:hypothetical protein
MEVREQGPGIVLVGPPRGASAIVRETAGQRVVLITLLLSERPTVHSAYLRPFGRDTSQIRLRLPRDTPPGTYRGQAPLGGEQREVMVVVEPVLHVQLQPGSSAFTTGAGSSVVFAIGVTNAGNVAFDVPKSVAFDLDDSGDQERALGRTLRSGLEPGERRVDRLFEELRTGHGGEARVSLAAGAGPLAPGESRELKCVLEIPAAVQAGRTYEGAWQLADAAHAVVITVQNGARSKEGS